MLPRKNFEKLHTVMAILVLFKQFLEKVYHIFLASNFESFTNDAFCLRGFDYVCLRRLKHIVMKRFEIIEKFCSSKALLKMAGRCGMHAQHIPHPPGSSPGCIITKDGLKLKRDVLN